MLFRDDPVDLIRKGNIDKLRKMLEKKPELLETALSSAWFTWPDGRGKKCMSSGNILHIAAYFNQPKIIEFLVNEKDMQVNQPNQKSQRTPLHYACEAGSFEAASLLFQQLGAYPTLRCCGGVNLEAGTAYEVCKDDRIKALLLPAHEAQIQQKEAEKQAIRRQEFEELGRAIRARMAGTWEINPSTSEIVHKHLLPGREFEVTDAFNFAAGRFISITEKLSNGSVSHKQDFFKPEEVADNPTLSEAFAKLQELTGKTGSTADAKPRVAGLKLRMVNKGVNL